MNSPTLDTARRALGFVSPDDREVWIRMGMALKSEFGDDAFGMWDEWSSAAKSYSKGAAKASWKSFKLSGKVGIGTLFATAKMHGFEFNDTDKEVSPEEIAKRQYERAEREKAAEARRVRAAEIASKRAMSQWRMAEREGASAYLSKKQVLAESVRFIAGGIIIPMMRYDFNPPRMVGKQAILDDGSKKYSSGMDKSGAMCRLGDVPMDGDVIYVGEGYATCGSIRAALEYKSAVYACFDTSGLMEGAKILRALFPNSLIVLCADDDYLTNAVGEKKAREAAEAIGNARITLPKFTAARRLSKKDESLPHLTDFNDLHVAEGIDVVRAQLLAPVADSPRPLPDVEPQSDDIPSGEALLFRFALVKGTTDIWDGIEKRKFKQSAFNAYVGKKEASAWMANPKKKVIDKAALPVLIGGAAVGGGTGRSRLDEMLENITLLRGTETVWDMVGRQVMSLGAVRADYTPELTSKWQEHPLRNTVEAKNLVFDPTQTVDLNSHVNIFFGWPLTPKENIDLVNPIIELIYSLAGEDHPDLVVPFILRWLAYPLQHPGAKMQTALLVFGEKQGTGKSLLFDTIVRPIYGEYGTTVGQHQLESGFTDWRSRKLYTLFEEVLSRDDKFSHNGTLKYMITGKKMQVNPKNLPLREEENHMNCVFLSNEPQPIPIELEDRRFLVVQARNIRDKAFYESVVHAVENGGIEAFYHYLLNFPLDDFNPHTKPPMTRAKERVIAFGRASWDAFHSAWRDGILDAPYCTCLSSDLYIVYKRWCDRNGEKPLSQTKFSGFLDSRETKVKRDVSLGSKPKKSYIIFEIGNPTFEERNEQCTRFRDVADVHGLGN